MSTLGLLLLAAFFAALAVDAYQFDRTSRHRIWVNPFSTGRAVGVDPLSRRAQESAQTNRFTAIGGIPGLFWVFVVLAVGCLVLAGWRLLH